MMSFRHAQDATYIAQLLGRMIRTPLQRHIDVDETLNEVRLFLPHFDKDNVKAVTKALQDEEGSEIPADVEGEAYGNDKRETWGYRPRRQQPVNGQISLDDLAQSQGMQPDPLFAQQSESQGDTPNAGGGASGQGSQLYTNINHPSVRANRSTGAGAETNKNNSEQPASEQPVGEQMTMPFTGIIDREAIANFINDTALITYDIKPFKTTDYLPSLIRLASLIKNTGLNPEAMNNVHQDGIKMIEAYIQKLRDDGEYDKLAAEIRKLNLAWQVFDAFGMAIDKDREYSYFTSSDEDIDRKFRIAEKLLGGFGLGSAYGVPHFDPANPTEYMIHVILFATNPDCIKRLHLYAMKRFNELSDEYRLKFARLAADTHRKQYDEIISNGNEVSEHSFRLPEQIRPIVDPDGEKYYNHFFVNEDTGYAKIKLDTWEKAVIEEESKRSDFVCWLRNPSTEKWALCLRRFEGGVVKRFFPDFLIIRNEPGIGYVIDILEPHRGDLTDNLSKAKALVEYAQKQPSAPIGRIQLIREGKDSVTGAKRMKRLDLAKSAVKAKVMTLQTTIELDHLFLDDSMVD